MYWDETKWCRYYTALYTAFTEYLLLNACRRTRQQVDCTLYGLSCAKHTKLRW